MSEHGHEPHGTGNSGPEREGLTEANHAEDFISVYGEHLRFDHARKLWFIFVAVLHRWLVDRTNQVWSWHIEFARAGQLRAAMISDTTTREKAERFYKFLQSAPGIRHVLAIVQNLAPVGITGEEWDGDPWLLGTPSGVVDLRTGILRAGRPDDLITSATGVPFDPAAECPRWLRFLDEVFGGDRDLIHYIWLALGYTLTGVTTEQTIWLLWGTGANGKSTFLTIIAYILGDYGHVIPFTTIELPQRSAIPDDLAALRGKRFVSASEAIEGARLNEARLKMLSGGDPVPARHLYGRWFSFLPALALWLSCNHRPRVEDDSHGFWRRVHLVPFTRQLLARRGIPTSWRN